MTVIARFSPCRVRENVVVVEVRLRLKFATNQCALDPLGSLGSTIAQGGRVRWLDDRGRRVARLKPSGLNLDFGSSGSTSGLTISMTSGLDQQLHILNISNAGSYATACRSAEGFTGWQAAPGPVTLITS